MFTNSSSLYQVVAIKQLETIAINKYGISVDTLMQRAGAAALRVLQQEFPRARRIVVVCGKGNNAGDGYVLARCALRAGYAVHVLSIVPHSELKGAARRAAAAYVVENEGKNECCNDSAHDAVNSSKADISTADVIVDALLGTGLQGALQQTYVDAIKFINAARTAAGVPIPVLALDVPSGLLADSGAVACCAVTGVPLAVHAQVTATFLGLKCGLFTNDGMEFCGKVINDDLDVPVEIFAQVVPCAQLLCWEELRLVKRQRNAHKGDFGHVVILGGDYGMGGAVRMAAEAAARVGAGLVSVGTRREQILAINAARPEVMCHEITSVQDVERMIASATCVVLGPGLGKMEWGRMIFDVLWQTRYLSLPMVIDADALHLLAEKAASVDDSSTSCFALKRLEESAANLILTPHPGEAARLLALPNSATVQSDRYAAALELQRKYRATIILKGAGSLVVARAEAEAATAAAIKVSPYGNPGMASGGMGDLLSGVVGGLLAQNLCARDAAELGVCAHALAGDLAAQAGGGERGLLALDLLPYVRELVN